MKNSSKKILFVLFGLCIIGIGIFIGNLNVNAAIKSGQKFNDWEVSCSTDEKKKQLCFLYQQVVTNKDETINDKENKQQVVAIYQIGYLGKGKDKSLQMIQILPANVTVKTGTSIISSKKLIAPGQYVICNPSYCQAIAKISQKDLNTILISNENFIGIVTSEGKQINFPLSKKGLKEGLTVLKK